MNCSDLWMNIGTCSWSINHVTYPIRPWNYALLFYLLDELSVVVKDNLSIECSLILFSHSIKQRKYE